MSILDFICVACSLGGILEDFWMIWRNAGGICERKILFRMKK